MYVPVILIDSIDKKDENYYFFRKIFFIEDIEIYCSNSDEECINFLSLGLESSISQSV